MATLLAYFTTLFHRNARLVAHRIGILVHTVCQRLTTIENMLGSLDNPTRALEMHMALRLWSLSRRSETARHA